MKNFVIVGASSGIGLRIAQMLSKENQIFATYFQHEMPEQTNLRYYKLDIREDSPDFSFLPDTVDGLIYCPGSISLKPFKRIKPEEFVSDYELQLIGAVKTIQNVLPKMKNSNNASIVLFSTVAVQTGFNFHSLVASSKGAIEGLTRSLAAELAPKIRVNCIAPSLTETPLSERLLNSEDKRKANSERHPLKRIGNTDDIANMAEFLLSEKSSWISGQILKVDGGISTIKN